MSKIYFMLAMLMVCGQGAILGFLGVSKAVVFVLLCSTVLYGLLLSLSDRVGANIKEGRMKGGGA